MRSFRTPVVAAATVALLASCGVAPQNRPASTAGANAQQDGAAARATARYRTLTAPTACACNAAFMSAFADDGNGRGIITNFVVVDEGASDTSLVQLFLGASVYEGTANAVAISGGIVTITGTLQNINGSNPDIAVTIVLDATTGGYTVNVNGTEVITSTASVGNFGLVPASCTIPEFRFPYPQ